MLVYKYSSVGRGVGSKVREVPVSIRGISQSTSLFVSGVRLMPLRAGSSSLLRGCEGIVCSGRASICTICAHRRIVFAFSNGKTFVDGSGGVRKRKPSRCRVTVSMGFGPCLRKLSLLGPCNAVCACDLSFGLLTGEGVGPRFPVSRLVTFGARRCVFACPSL